MKTIYVVHPITKEQKGELVKQGKIIDAKFAPDGAEIINPNESKPKRPTRKVEADTPTEE